MTYGFHLRTVAAAAIGLLASVGTSAAGTAPATWATVAGAEADKGASIWLIRRRIAPSATVLVVVAGQSMPSGVTFDIPEAKFRRTQTETTFESLVRVYGISDPAVTRLAQILHDIEINAWRPKRFAESVTIEGVTRALADRYPGVPVPQACFLDYFDAVYTWLAKGQTGSSVPGAAPSCDLKNK